MEASKIFLAHLRQQGYSPSTLRVYRAALLGFHAWRGEKEAGTDTDIPGFCKSAALEEIHKHGHVLTPGRYVGAEAQEDDGEPFEEKMQRLTAQWRGQVEEAHKLDAAIEVNLRDLGYGD